MGTSEEPVISLDTVRNAERLSEATVLVRSREGVFYELPMSLAAQFVIDGRRLNAAVAHYTDLGNTAALTDSWAKMSW